MNVISLFFFVFAGFIALLGSLSFLSRTNRFSGLKTFLLMDKDSQQEIFNRGWRIKLLTSTNPTGIRDSIPEWTQSIELLGGVMFLTGIGVLAMNEPTRMDIGFPLFTIGFATAIAVPVGTTKLRGRNWPLVTAKCIDVEIHNDDDQWMVRMICEYEFRGTQYRGTPSFRSLYFNGEQGIQKYLSQTISSEGHYTLRVNPKDPLDTILTVTSIKTSSRL